MTPDDWPLWHFRATVRRIVDGDTLDVTADQGFGGSQKLRIKLDYTDTPEIYGVKHDSDEYAAGVEATTFVENRIAPGDTIYITTTKAPGFSKGKYGRWLAEVYYVDSGDLVLLNEELIEAGMAVRQTFD